MSTTTVPTRTTTPAGGRGRPVRRRLASLGLVAVVAGGAALALGACTPSAHQVEKKAVAHTHAWFEGRSVTWSAVQCTEFVLQGSTFNGTCWAEGHEYAVSTNYSGDVATAYVRNSGGLTKSSNWIKGGDGNWSFFSWQF